MAACEQAGARVSGLERGARPGVPPAPPLNPKVVRHIVDSAGMRVVPSVQRGCLLMHSKPGRLPYADSCRVLQDAGLLDAGAIPALPQQPPRHDDEVLGVEFFRTQLADAKLENLTLPRTFFGRSEIRAVSFRGTDLGESTMCWNDFIDVDFSGADLVRADLRASTFERVVFDGADLTGADLLRSTFNACSWKGAILTKVKLTTSAARAIPLTADQRGQIDLQDSDGPEPEGG